jgi:Cu/Ag efflux pump CusA
VGLLTTMGLASKNAILIVEFAKDLHEKGMDLVEATVEAVRIRLRPIIMTSLAFVFGVLPLAISNGAGSGSQHAIGTGVIGGMLGDPAGDLLRPAVLRDRRADLQTQAAPRAQRRRPRRDSGREPLRCLIRVT